MTTKQDVLACLQQARDYLSGEQMRRVGCNAIRLSIHRLGCDWWDERADCLRRHPHADGFFRDDRIDNFLRFVAAFNRHGIYFLMGSGGGPQEIEAMMAGDAESLEYYRQFTIRLLNRRNPYTGNLVKDEPCLLGWEFANEQSVQHVQHIVAEVPNPDAPRSSFHPVQAKYAARVRTLVKPRWEAFLKKKYGDGWARHAAYPKRYTEKTPNALDFQLFSQELMEAQIRFYRDVMKEAGWDRPTMWGNYDKILRTTETRVKTGMATEVNNYHSFLADDGHGPQVSSATDGMAAFRDIAGAAIPGQPVVVTEYNDCQHNRYCHEMGLAAGVVGPGAAPGGELDGVLDAAVQQLSTAVAELRQIAHGLRPASLDDGLGAALGSMLERVPVPVELRVDLAGGATAAGQRPDVPESVATTAYYVASEAVANAVKHAAADRIALSATRTGGLLVLRVSDDGRGGALACAGSGLAGLADRVAAAGGHLHLASPVGAGTLLEVRLPCGS